MYTDVIFKKWDQDKSNTVVISIHFLNTSSDFSTGETRTRKGDQEKWLSNI